MKLKMPTVKGYGMYGGIRQRGTVKFGGIRQRGPVVFGGRKRLVRRRRIGLLRPLQGGMARRRVHRRRRRVGRARPRGYFTGKTPMNSYSFGHARRRRRVHHGRGFFDTLKNLGSKALGIARSIPIASTALNYLGHPAAGGVARSLGFARRRRHRRRRVGMARRRVHRRRHRVGMARHRRRRRRVGMARRRRRIHRGRGLLSSLLGMTGLGRRRRRIGRGASYRRLLNVPYF